MEISIKYDDGRFFSSVIDEASSVSEAQEVFDKMLLLCGYFNNIRCSDGGKIEVYYKEEK